MALAEPVTILFGFPLARDPNRARGKGLGRLAVADIVSTSVLAVARRLRRLPTPARRVDADVDEFNAIIAAIVFGERHGSNLGV
jgi:hypothetical protein